MTDGDDQGFGIPGFIGALRSRGGWEGWAASFARRRLGTGGRHGTFVAATTDAHHDAPYDAPYDATRPPPRMCGAFGNCARRIAKEPQVGLPTWGFATAREKRQP